MAEILVNIILIVAIVAVAISSVWFGLMLITTIKDGHCKHHKRRKHYDPYEYPERRSRK